MADGGTKMTVIDPKELRKKGLDALAKALGPVGMVRFLQQFETGTGDYTKEREKWLKGLNIERITKDIKKQKQDNFF